MPQRRSGMTGCKNSPQERSYRIHSPMAHPLSGSAGSKPALQAEVSVIAILFLQPAYNHGYVVLVWVKYCLKM